MYQKSTSELFSSAVNIENAGITLDNDILIGISEDIMIFASEREKLRSGKKTILRKPRVMISLISR